MDKDKFQIGTFKYQSSSALIKTKTIRNNSSFWKGYNPILTANEDEAILPPISKKVSTKEFQLIIYYQACISYQEFNV